MDFFTSIFENDFKLIIPELYLSLSLLTLLVGGVFFKKEKNTKLIESISWLSIEVLFITILLFLNNVFPTSLIFSSMLLIDNLTINIKIILLISTLVVMLISFDYYKNENIFSFEYVILILLATLGLLFLVSSYDLLAFYLAIELQSLSLYILATYKRNSEFSTEAGLKYFILGAVSSGFLLFGSSLIYGLIGSTNFEIINHLLIIKDMNSNESLGVVIGLIFIAASLLFKLAAAPFHMWAPDVYEGSPTIVTAYFAIVPKIALMGLFIELFLENLYGFIIQWQPIIIFSALASMILGALGALEQKKIKRFIAYSAISHIGYMLIGLAAGTSDGVQSLFLYIIVYIVMSVNLFSFYLSLYKKDSNVKIKNIYELVGLSQENSVLAITFALTLLSMAGIPPLAGFFSKFYLFLAAISSSMYLLAIVGVLTSVIGAVYYIRLIKIMYFDKTNMVVSYKEIDFQKALILALTFFFIIFFLFNPSYLLVYTHMLALNLSI